MSPLHPTPVPSLPAAAASSAGASNAPYGTTQGRRFYLDPATQERCGVTEVDAANTPGARAPRCLVFVSSTAIRRVWRYPPGWRALSDDELAALSRTG